MIYIIKKYKDDFSVVDAVLEVAEGIDVKSLYYSFLKEQSDKEGIIINPHYYMIMSFEKYHQHLNIAEYDKKQRSWDKFLNKWTLRKFMELKLNAKNIQFDLVYSK